MKFDFDVVVDKGKNRFCGKKRLFDELPVADLDGADIAIRRNGENIAQGTLKLEDRRHGLHLTCAGLGVAGLQDGQSLSATFLQNHDCVVVFPKAEKNTGELDRFLKALPKTTI
ncbi:MAG: hypothetical protein DI551_06605 [Micavibrio aeruginosavorus]|uniref:Uncharacterized protein n=1 Tax=Micavibrio aeruginosavorus TaxID=349221 RepID=A0A2W5MYA8_9BACT|nr:MAG: hypothetical protein DI551_06605 [Micavibrio aeruginosavorus]